MAAPQEEHGPAHTPQDQDSTAATPRSGKRDRRKSGTTESTTPSTYVGKRVAPSNTSDHTPTSAATGGTDGLPEHTLEQNGPEARATAADTSESSARDDSTRQPLWRRLTNVPVAIGLAAASVAALGGLSAATSAANTPETGDDPSSRIEASNALSGFTDSGISGIAEDRDTTVSRDMSRTELADQAQSAESDATEREKALAELNRAATGQKEKLEAEKRAAAKREAAAERAAARAEERREAREWQLPIPAGQYEITNTFGVAASYYASTHTGLDFAAPSGTPIHAIHSGEVTSTTYDGSYGNQTIITLDDGTEIWYCHQTDFAVSPGDEVDTGDVIGYVGSTGNSTGPHLHVEVRPGGGDPVDPDSALQQHGLNP